MQWMVNTYIVCMSVQWKVSSHWTIKVYIAKLYSYPVDAFNKTTLLIYWQFIIRITVNLLIKGTVHQYQSHSSTSKHNITVTFWHVVQHYLASLWGCYSMDRAWKFILSQRTFSMQNGNSHNCLPAIDRADKAVHGSITTLANCMP